MIISNSLLILLIFFIALSLFFGFVILLTDKGWENKTNKRFFIFTIMVVAWQITSLAMLSAKDLDFALIWSRLSYISAVIMIYSLLRFIFIFPNDYPNQKFIKIVDILGFITTLAVSVLSLGPYLITSVSFNNNILNAQYGSFFPVIAATLILYLLIIFLIAGINYKKATDSSKDQIKFVIIGIVVSATIAIFTDLISPFILKTDILSNFGIFGTIFLVAFTAYAIVKHQLFNIKVILTETAVVIVLFAVFMQLLFAQTFKEKIVNIVILIFVIYGGYLVIKSVKREIKFREELQTLTDQLAKANAHLKDLDKMKTEFVSLASHELLTPVSAIEGYLSMILDEHLAKVDDPKAAQYLDRIYRSSRRLARLIADMLNISRIEEGRLLVEKKDVNLNELVTQTIDELKFKAEERKQKIIFAMPNVKLKMSNEIQNQNDKNANKLRDSSSPAAIQNDTTKFETYADPDKIKEVIVNIIGNSIKYSKDPGTISVSIEKAPTEKVQEIWAKIEDQVKNQPLDDQEAIKASVNEYYRQFVGKEQLLIIVKDQGIGIPKEELTKLFKKFHRVGDYSTEESQGTGLGLYISRSLVELHHGRIWADSEGRGKGSTFTFSLPDISDKEALLEMEKQVPNQKEQLKPLAKPMNEKVGEDI